MAEKRPQLRADQQRRSRGFEAASKIVAGHMRAPAERRGFSEAKLLTRWREIVGDETAAMCEPVRLTHSKGTTIGSTLVVLTTGAQAPVLAMDQERILARVNSCYGYRAVNKLRITQTAPAGFAEGQALFTGPRKEAAEQKADPTKLAEARDEISKLGNHDLKDALSRLSEKVLARHASDKGDTA